MRKWVPAIVQESVSWKYVIFFTLTYEDQYLPKIDIYNYEVDKKYEKDFEYHVERSRSFIDFHHGYIPVLQTSDVQRFIKRLREIIYRTYGLRKALRYFISGDYGSTLFRPHWHGILWFNDSRLGNSFGSLIRQAWSVYDKAGRTYSPIGIVDADHAYSAARYVASYVQAADHRPSIYDYRDFRPKALHSSHPSLGSLVRPLESVQAIVERGLSEITVYDPKTFAWRKTALLPNLVHRLFPRIPSFLSLSRAERHEIYRIVSSRFGYEPDQRRELLMSVMSLNSFFRDYVLHTFPYPHTVTVDQIHQKLDRIYYAVSRLYNQCSILNISFIDYDDYIASFLNKRKLSSLCKQLEYEQRYISNHGSVSALEDALNYHRHSDTSKIDPNVLDPLYFASQYVSFNKMIKRKCDNAYLEKHPEFKQFHS